MLCNKNELRNKNVLIHVTSEMYFFVLILEHDFFMQRNGIKDS